MSKIGNLIHGRGVAFQRIGAATLPGKPKPQGQPGSIDDLTARLSVRGQIGTMANPNENGQQWRDGVGAGPNPDDSDTDAGDPA